METRPDIYGFICYRTWLRAWFDWKKTVRPTYSHRLFARRAGQRSPSTLIQVMDGTRNVSDTALEGFVKALDLEGDEERFFRDLVQLDQGVTPAVRSQALERVLATQRFRETRSMEGELTQVLSDWHGPAIFELAGCPDFRLDPEWIASRLDPAISLEEAQDAVDLLLRVGMLERSPEGVRRQAPRFGIPQPVHRTAALRYHLAMLRLAARGLERFDEKARFVSGFTTAIDPARLPELQEEMESFLARFFGRCEGEETPREAYQLSLAFFPLSDRREG